MVVGKVAACESDSPHIFGPYGALNTPDHPATHPPRFSFVVFLHNRQCSPNFCFVFSTAISIYTNFPTPKQPRTICEIIYVLHILQKYVVRHIVSPEGNISKELM